MTSGTIIVGGILDVLFGGSKSRRSVGIGHLMDMGYRALILALALGLAPSVLPAGQEEDRPVRLQEGERARQEEDRRIRAKKPTVVTVEGKISPVETKGESEERSLGEKIGGAVKTGAAKTWHGLGALVGWMFNVDQDVPSERERVERSTREREKEQ